MFTSCEVRWFFSEPLWGLSEWFGRRGMAFHPDSEPLRCDFYLIQPRRKDLGIKLREGNIEVKERTKHLGIRQFRPGVCGRMELWRKWSFRLAATREGGTDEVLAITRQYASNAWTPVYKDRLLVLFEIEEEGRVVLLDRAYQAKEGCGIELTRIQIAGHVGFTFALEAFSVQGTARKNLLRVMDAFLAEVPTLSLSVEQSLSYPGFLTRETG